jgi:hypothetical protein
VVLVVVVVASFADGYLPHRCSQQRLTQSAQVLLALQQVTAQQEGLRSSGCTLKPRAAAAVLMGTQRDRYRAV